MKKYSAIIFLLFIGISKSYGQVGIVSDPTSYGYYAKQLTTATEAMKVANEQVSTLKKTKEKLEKFNAKLQNITTFLRVVDESERSVSSIDRCINDLKKMEGVDIRIINNTLRKFLMIGSKTTGNIKDIQEILKSNNINMTDKERIELVDIKLKEMRDLSAEANITLRRVNQIQRTTNWINKF